MEGKLGHWAFLIGVVLVVVAGFVPDLGHIKVKWTIVLLGLLVGLLNITSKETQEFLIAAIALILASNAAGSMVELGSTTVSILGNIVLFVFPAALVVAFKTVWRLASEA